MLSNMLLFLTFSLFYITVDSQSCLEYELGPPQNLEATLSKNRDMTLTWIPPENYETCEVEYLLHIRNANTSEYIIPVQKVSNLSYTFSYKDHVCFNCLYTVYATYSGLTSTGISNLNFLDPVSDIGAPATLFLRNSEETLKLEWTPPEGLEQCQPIAIYTVEFYDIEEDVRFYSYMLIRFTLEHTYTYNLNGSDSRFFCHEIAVKLYVLIASQSKMISKTMTFGPNDYCLKKIAQLK